MRRDVINSLPKADRVRKGRTGHRLVSLSEVLPGQERRADDLLRRPLDAESPPDRLVRLPSRLSSQIAIAKAIRLETSAFHSAYRPHSR
jgi:hypothetical protein